jgi:hypothetical protein
VFYWVSFLLFSFSLSACILRILSFLRLRRNLQEAYTVMFCCCSPQGTVPGVLPTHRHQAPHIPRPRETRNRIHQGERREYCLEMIHSARLSRAHDTSSVLVCREANGNHYMQSKRTNSVASVRDRTIPTERPPLDGEISANFCGYRGVA